MQPLSTTSAAGYLAASGIVGPHDQPAIRELSGGVSNVVLLVECEDGRRLVLKQALPRLRVAQEWLCSIERIWREVEVLRLCGRLVGQEPGVVVHVPEVLFEDRENYCFAMTAAPEAHKTWKELLLAGNADGRIAAACGRMLGRLHAGSWLDVDVARQFDDRTFFRDLRISPYYDRIAEVHTDLAERIQNVTDSIWRHRRCLVHGDFSPKNLLVADSELWLIDFEVGHYGDPSFDLGFFLTHLILKAYVAGKRGSGYFALIDEFGGAYNPVLAPIAGEGELAALWQRTVGALAGCLLARVDGKSPVDYLTPELQDVVRRAARDLFLHPPDNFEELLARLRRGMPAAGR